MRMAMMKISMMVLMMMVIMMMMMINMMIIFGKLPLLLLCRLQRHLRYQRRNIHTKTVQSTASSNKASKQTYSSRSLRT